ncbi:iron-sulfur cluster biosynthesis family protein [Gorillibacterium massiliense]|uniref:iron-sulfur cluster biosynthesis family protein n=1 Tax=Gorillibacterium massiliense TaxID=1280390 RepID=UPI0004B561C6|nr:iron-sulfur cluster biosynthesis family protein [Gorillibacterium massiliense]
MRVHFNTFTRDKLQESLGSRPGFFKIYNDTEDCGCNGIMVVLIVGEPDPTDLPVESDEFTFIVDNRQSHLFDDVLKLEANTDYPDYRLTSDGTFYGSNIRVRDTRPAA